MLPFSVVFALGHARVHIHSSDGDDVVSYIETSVNKALCLAPTLDIPNIQPNNGHVQFWGYLNNTQF